MAETMIAPARPETGNGDNEIVAHYARKSDIVRAHVEGVAIEALCGTWWTPTRDPEQFPICSQCKALKEAGVVFPPRSP